MKTIKCIDLSQPGAYTTGVMEYADEHPDERFDHTAVYDGQGKYCMMVSEYEPTEIDRKCDKRGLTEWHDLPNGWQRTGDANAGVWVCRKGERNIIITN